MAYSGIAWPGLELSIKAINGKRANVARWLKSLEDNPNAYKRPKQLRTKWEVMLADYDTGLRMLRAEVKAHERRPARRNRVDRSEIP